LSIDSFLPFFLSLKFFAKTIGLWMIQSNLYIKATQWNLNMWPYE
jgi:hypothetical protein